MQARGGGSDRAWILCKHRLVARAIRRFVRALDVRRQRYMAKALQMLVHCPLVMRLESQRAQAEFPARDDFGFQLSFAEEHLLPNVHLSPRAYQRLPHVISDSA